MSVRAIRRKLSELDISTEYAAKYRTLAVAAADLGLDAEADRLQSTAVEYDVDADDLRDQLLALGYDPDDDDRQADHIAGEASMAGSGIL